VGNRNFALACVSCFALLAAWLGWSARQQTSRAEEELRIAEEQRKQADDILLGATTIIGKMRPRMDPETQKEAFSVFQAGALHGNINAMNDLALSYEYGLGGPPDLAKAREWLEKAARKGHLAAMVNLGNLYANRQGAAQDYAKAREWYQKVVDMSEPGGQGQSRVDLPRS
jgi:TPR repeat protein